MNELIKYKQMINLLGWRLENNGKIVKKDWEEIVIPVLKELSE